MTNCSGSDGKESARNAGDLGSIPGLGRSPEMRMTTQYSCLENPHRQRSLAGYSPWGCKKSDMTEWLKTAQQWRSLNHNSDFESELRLTSWKSNFRCSATKIKQCSSAPRAGVRWASSPASLNGAIYRSKPSHYKPSTGTISLVLPLAFFNNHWFPCKLGGQ